jgi:hypothetical protein
MAQLRGRKQAITYQFLPETIELVKLFAEHRGLSKQVAAERLIMSGLEYEMKAENEVTKGETK